VAKAPWAAVQAGLFNATVSRLHVICSAAELERLGCPVDLVRQATIAVSDAQDRLAPEWIEVLERHSECSPEYVQEQELLHRIQRSVAERTIGT
jgi:hypothetical protein